MDGLSSYCNLEVCSAVTQLHLTPAALMRMNAAVMVCLGCAAGRIRSSMFPMWGQPTSVCAPYPAEETVCAILRIKLIIYYVCFSSETICLGLQGQLGRMAVLSSRWICGGHDGEG